MATEGTKFRFPDPFLEIQKNDRQTFDYLNELIRSLYAFDTEIFTNITENIDDLVDVSIPPSGVRNFVEVSTNYVASAGDSVILVDASVSTRAILLPSTSSTEGQTFDVKKIDTNGATVVSVEGSGPEFPVILNTGGRPSVTLFSTGEDYWII